LSTIIFYKKKV